MNGIRLGISVAFLSLLSLLSLLSHAQMTSSPMSESLSIDEKLAVPEPQGIDVVPNCGPPVRLFFQQPYPGVLQKNSETRKISLAGGLYPAGEVLVGGVSVTLDKGEKGTTATIDIAEGRPSAILYVDFFVEIMGVDKVLRRLDLYQWRCSPENLGPTKGRLDHFPADVWDQALSVRYVFRGWAY